MKNNKGFAPIVIVLIIVAVLAVGGIAYYAGKSSAPAPQDTQENNVTNTPVVNSTTNVSFAIISPKEGDQWVTGKTYSISLSQGLLEDYHPLLHSFVVINSQGKGIGTICPDTGVIKKGGSSFNWIAGATLYEHCTGTGNLSSNMPQGKYQIVFTESDINGKEIRTVKSGWFSIITSTIPSLKITFPTAGAILVEGQTYNITWDGVSISSATHSVSLENKNGNIGLMPETGANISGRSISWTVPYLESFGERKIFPGDGFRILIFPIGKYPQEAYYSPVFKIVK